MSEVDETEADMTQRDGYVSGGYARGGYCSGYASRGSGGYAYRGSGGYGSGGYASRGSGGYGSDKSVSGGNASRGIGGYGRVDMAVIKVSAVEMLEMDMAVVDGLGDMAVVDMAVKKMAVVDMAVIIMSVVDMLEVDMLMVDMLVDMAVVDMAEVDMGVIHMIEVDMPVVDIAKVGMTEMPALIKLQNDDNEDQEKEDKEIDVESTMCNEEVEFPNSSDFEHNLEDGSGLSYLDEEEDTYEETITIDDPDNSISAVDYLMEKDVVAVHVELSEDGLRRILCVTEDKSYTFELENNPFLMTSGKVAKFFSWTPEPKGPTKVFHGLDSKTCAVFFDKYDIILDGTKIYDLKIAYDLMKERCLDAHITELNKTGFSPYNCIYNINTVCLTYIKAYQYLSQVQLLKEISDYKKHLFEMVRAEIDSEKLKKAKEKKKKEYKAANIERLSHLGQKSKSKKHKRKMDFPVRQLASELKEKEITNEREEKLENIPSKDSANSKIFTAAEQLPKNCKSASNLHTASSYPSLNNTLQQEFDETRQMARQCTTQKSQEEQCQVIAVVKHESVEFPDGRRYTCRSTVVPDPIIVEGKSTGTQTESDKCKDVGVQCEIIDWNKYQKMIELAEVLLK